MIEISKDKSIVIKGIVIMMMVFLHLFNGNHTDECVNLLYIGDVPFAKWLSNACGPVPFFLLLSGYGLAYTYEHSELTFLKQLRRIIRLYLHYWIILLCFLVIGWYLYPDRYPGSWYRLTVNAIGWKTDYNYEIWFLFPYSLVALTSKYIIHAIGKIGNVGSAILAPIVYFGSCYVISRYHATVMAEYSLLNIGVVYLQFISPFAIGVLFFRGDFRWNYKMSQWQVILMMICAVTATATIAVSVVSIVYVPIMVFLFCQLSLPQWLENILMELGRKSMPIWMIHTWYSNYLFHEQVYSLKYPIVIFVVVIAVSYLSSIPVMWITRKCIVVLKI